MKASMGAATWWAVRAWERRQPLAVWSNVVIVGLHGDAFGGAAMLALTRTPSSNPQRDGACTIVRVVLAPQPRRAHAATRKASIALLDMKAPTNKTAKVTC